MTKLVSKRKTLPWFVLLQLVYVNYGTGILLYDQAFYVFKIPGKDLDPATVDEVSHWNRRSRYAGLLQECISRITRRRRPDRPLPLWLWEFCRFEGEPFEFVSQGGSVNPLRDGP